MIGGGYEDWMPRRGFHRFWFALVLIVSCISARAQQAALAPIPQFPLTESSLTIIQPAQAQKPFSVTGETGAILGQQDGSFELWAFPIKVLAHVHLTAELEGYPVPIELNPLAATIEVFPDHTTITYAHAAFTVRQHMFLARGMPDAPAPIVLFEIRAVRPLMLTVNLDPVMERMWPALNPGRPGAGWVPMGTGGAYVLETDDPSLAGMVAMPNAQPGILPPYQERPKEYPLQFKVSYDPKRDADRYFPLLAAVVDGGPRGPARLAALTAKISAMAAHIPALYESSRNYYAHFFDQRLTTETPDARFDQAMRWAEISIDQLKVQKGAETGLVAGVYPSADSDRPGFGWFFGRDTLWTLYAVDSEGDFGLARQALEFLIARQRADGKIMHEYSQSADRVDWAGLGYEYASADATPLFIMAMEDYWRATGDREFVAKHWDNLRRANEFTRGHDTDGIYDNSQGTGWVEEWVPKLPHQELYLAALDQQSCASMAGLAATMGDAALANSAQQQAEIIRQKLAGYLGTNGIYGFSRNLDGTYDTTPTVYPSVAWWSGELNLPNASKTLDLYAGSDLSADWGTRAIAQSSALYDPISYHQGSVWPLFTGWASMAEYRAGRSLAGLQHLRENQRLVWSQDPGNFTELLSGRFNEPLGRSTAHQLWSAAMALTPAVRGLFGVEADVEHHTLRVAPQLPAEWPRAALHNVPFGDAELEVRYERQNTTMEITVTAARPLSFCLTEKRAAVDCKAAPATLHALRLPLPDVEVILPESALNPGDESHALRVVNQEYGTRTLTLTLEAPAGSEQVLRLQVNRAGLSKLLAANAMLQERELHVSFPAGAGFQRQAVTVRW